MSAPAASAAAVHSLTRWDRLLPLAHDAGIHAATSAFVDMNQFHADYIASFERVIRDAYPDLSPGEQVLAREDARFAYSAMMAFVLKFNLIDSIDFLYNGVALAFTPGGSPQQQQQQPIVVHRILRIYQHPHARAAFIQKLADAQARENAPLPAGVSSAFTIATQRADAQTARSLAAFIQTVLAPVIERTRFDASQMERHMSMVHRVPADVANLIGQFATTGITAQTPIPLRLQVKHRLELLTRRVASLTAAQVAAEMRSILREVEAAVPELQATKKAD